ncbi:hypothetical protein M427DRAFT_272620 [Gonapodya prolifera JEL478]|uniref:NADP-dependent oxidoreductase domain-containing protein n=1 Tax=Gonapodya prolifera (strain JEL478) TaxID=1344416 RepID=A0A139AXU7_GONPJ|nr:hypothetical protein M427DRAFT_272620 [Gonapodya prolifera JEL478]|eukprot:KXS21527.1 hypothetical protein M427DRAFT_272620 [Gonapodya prolifera JEL478]
MGDWGWCGSTVKRENSHSRAVLEEEGGSTGLNEADSEVMADARFGNGWIKQMAEWRGEEGIPKTRSENGTGVRTISQKLALLGVGHLVGDWSRKADGSPEEDLDLLKHTQGKCLSNLFLKPPILSQMPGGARVLYIAIFVIGVFAWYYLQKPSQTRALSNGVQIPLIGFGTAALRNPKESISRALESGYRLLDTASDTGPWYRTESVIGELLANRRQKVFLTSKVHPQDLGAVATLHSFEKSLKNLRTDYLDMLLLHYPRCWGDMCSRPSEGTWKDAWKVLEREYKKGRIRAIGVSNFNVWEMDELISWASVKPHLVQTHVHLFHQPWDLVDLCRKHGVLVQAYSSLQDYNRVMNVSAVVDIASKRGKTVPQIVLRFLLDNDVLVVPRSDNVTHITENFNVLDFRLSEDEVASLRNVVP